MSALYASIVSRLRTARSVLALTGAGISAESGVPTFRGAGGHWKQHRPEELATPEAFRRDPALVQEWYRHRRHALAACTPNAAHLALVELARRVPAFTLVTQNVDDLHERAGSREVIHLHGRIMDSFCASCRAPTDLDAGDEVPVVCTQCGGFVRPGVIWFGEALPADAFRRAEAAARAADVVLCIGTSGVVFPAAGLPLLALEGGAYGVEINPARSALTGALDVWIGEKAGTALPALLASWTDADA